MGDRLWPVQSGNEAQPAQFLAPKKTETKRTRHLHSVLCWINSRRQKKGQQAIGGTKECESS